MYEKNLSTFKTFQWLSLQFVLLKYKQKKAFVSLNNEESEPELLCICYYSETCVKRTPT